jgi:hypothetical protein
MKPAGNIGTVATKALSLLPKNAIRETKGRNAPQVEAAKRFAAEKQGRSARPRSGHFFAGIGGCGESHIVSETGRLDVAIHNAGHMVFGPAEGAADRVRAELLRSMELADLPKPSSSESRLRKLHSPFAPNLDVDLSRGGRCAIPAPGLETSSTPCAEDARESVSAPFLYPRPHRHVPKNSTCNPFPRCVGS